MMSGTFESTKPAHDAGPPEGATRVGRNTAFRLAAQIVSAVINVAGMMVLGNYLSAGGYGEYAFYYALVPLLAALGDAGVGVIVTRRIACDPEEAPRAIGDGLMIKGAIAIILLAALGIASARLLDPPHALLVLLVAAAAVLDFSQDPAVWLFRARERLDREALLLLTSQIAWLIGILAGVALHASLAFMLGSATVAFMVRAAVGSAWLWRSPFRPRFSPDAARIARCVGEGWPVGLAMFLVVLYGRSGVLILKAVSSSAEVACFNVAYLLSQPLGFASSALAIAAFPLIARRAEGDTAGLRLALRSSSKYQMLVTWPLTAAIIVLADRLIALMFHSPGFERAALSLRVVALGLPFIFLNLQSRYVLAAMNRQRVYLWAVTVGLILNAGLGLALIPRMGSVGAAWSFVAAEGVICAVCQWALSSAVPIADLAKTAGRPALAAGAAAVVILALRSAGLLLALLGGVATYAGALFALGGLSRRELRLIADVGLSLRPSAFQRALNLGERP